MNLKKLRALGFDLARHIPFTKQYSVRCSQCVALVINGYPTHETGCPHQPWDCAECGTPTTRHSYCESCVEEMFV